MKLVSGIKPRHPPDRSDRPKVINSGDLFGTAKEMIIDHYGQEYRLRITNLGKLILTK